MHNGTPAFLTELKIHSVFLVEILDFPYLPFVTKNKRPLGPSFYCYITVLSEVGLELLASANHGESTVYRLIRHPHVNKQPTHCTTSKTSADTLHTHSSMWMWYADKHTYTTASLLGFR